MLAYYFTFTSPLLLVIVNYECFNKPRKFKLPYAFIASIFTKNQFNRRFLIFVTI